MFRLALLPIDGSEPALAAVGAAVQAVAPDGSILLLSVIPPVEELLARIGATTPDARSAMELADISHQSQQAEAAVYLQEAAEAVTNAGGAVAGHVVAAGEPGPTILSVAALRGCDVIVMATNGRSGWKRALLGSVADYVSRNSEGVPLILVRRTS